MATLIAKPAIQLGWQLRAGNVSLISCLWLTEIFVDIQWTRAPLCAEFGGYEAKVPAHCDIKHLERACSTSHYL